MSRQVVLCLIRAVIGNGHSGRSTVRRVRPLDASAWPYRSPTPTMRAVSHLRATSTGPRRTGTRSCLVITPSRLPKHGLWRDRVERSTAFRRVRSARADQPEVAHELVPRNLARDRSGLPAAATVATRRRLPWPQERFPAPLSQTGSGCPRRRPGSECSPPACPCIARRCTNSIPALAKPETARRHGSWSKGAMAGAA